jgi:hypothetical protein
MEISMVWTIGLLATCELCDFRLPQLDERTTSILDQRISQTIDPGEISE